MKTSEKLISNSIYLFLQLFSSVLFSFIFWLIIGKAFNPSEYGIIATSINFVILSSGFLMLGISAALTKLIPEILIKKGVEDVNSLIKLSIRPLIILSIFLIPILLFFSNQFSLLLKIPHNIMIVNIISLFIYIFFLFFGAVQYSLQNMKNYSLTDFFQYLFRIIFGVILLFFGFGYFGILIGFYLSYLLFIFFRLDLNHFKGNKKPLISYKKLFDYALPALLITISSAIIMNGQYIILSILKNTEVTGLFAVALTPISMITILLTVLNSGLVPIISGLSADHKTKGQQTHLISIILRYALFFAFPAAILMLVFSKYVILLLSKPEFLPSTSYFPILIPAAIFNGLGLIFQTNIYAIGYPKKSRDISVFIALLFLSVSIPLTYFYSAFGISFAYLVTMIFSFFISFFGLRKFLKIKFPWNDFKKIVISSLIISLVSFLLKPFVNSLLLFISTSIVIGLFYLLVLLFLKFYRIEDVKILEFLSHNMPFGNRLTFLIDFLRSKIKE
jgi:O-antigen/teichoic acid export membrane protein